MSKLSGVIRCHPDASVGEALVYVSDEKAFTEAKAKAALAATKELRFIKMEAQRS